MARIRETIIAFGKKKQADIATANIVGDLWRLHKTNASLANPNLVTEDDAADIGKGHEFATQNFRSHKQSGPHTLEKYMSSEWAAWMWAYGLGKTTVSGSSPFTYTSTPLDPVTDGEELPYFSFAEGIRPGGGGVVLDRLLVGNRVSAFRILIASGPGRANARGNVTFMGSGKDTDPSGITFPASTAETALNAYSLTANINGIDYIAAKNFVSLEMGMDTPALDESDFYPGSGQDDSFQVRGRMEIGDRVPVFNFVARFVAGSSELTKLKNLTAGTAVVSLTADVNNTMTVTWHQVIFSAAEIGDTNGIVTVAVTGKPMMHPTNGLVTAVTKCAVADIGQ